jgi:hypothetical protein
LCNAFLEDAFRDIKLVKGWRRKPPAMKLLGKYMSLVVNV